jgi:hypothetical protein
MDVDRRERQAYGIERTPSGASPVRQLSGRDVRLKKVTRAMSMYQFILAILLAAYAGFSRLHHLRFLAREPMLTGILKVLRLPPQCTFWRSPASLHQYQLFDTPSYTYGYSPPT